jgi:hypothetical protein
VLLFDADENQGRRHVVPLASRLTLRLADGGVETTVLLHNEVSGMVNGNAAQS